MDHNALIETLLKSNEPSIRWKASVNLLSEDRNSSRIKMLEQQIKNSDRVQSLLQRANDDGTLASQRNVYDKFQGAHWVLVTLSDIGYPKSDNTLIPIANQVLDFWLQERFFNAHTAVTKADAYKIKDAIPVIQGRHRICGAQHADALLAMLRLGLTDERIHELAQRLKCWQWPDGGWNCDKNPDAKTSTIPHTLNCMRALALYAKETGDTQSAECALRASEYFLKRRLFKRLSDGQVIKPESLKFHYPLYWHYDILGA